MFVPVNILKTYTGRGGISPHILNVGTGWRQVFSFSPQYIYPQVKNAHYPPIVRLGWPHIWSRRFEEQKNSMSLLRFEPRAIQPAA